MLMYLWHTRRPSHGRHLQQGLGPGKAGLVINAARMQVPKHARAASALTAHVHAGSDDLVNEQELRRHDGRALEHLRRLKLPCLTTRT